MGGQARIGGYTFSIVIGLIIIQNISSNKMGIFVQKERLCRPVARASRCFFACQFFSFHQSTPPKKVYFSPNKPPSLEVLEVLRLRSCT